MSNLSRVCLVEHHIVTSRLHLRIASRCDHDLTYIHCHSCLAAVPTKRERERKVVPDILGHVDAENLGATVERNGCEGWKVLGAYETSGSPRDLSAIRSEYGCIVRACSSRQIPE